jgi:hypothetical protein
MLEKLLHFAMKLEAKEDIQDQMPFSIFQMVRWISINKFMEI